MNEKKQNIFIDGIQVGIGTREGAIVIEIDSEVLDTTARLICGDMLAPDGFVGISFLTKDEVLVCALLTNEQALEVSTVLVNAAKRGETEQ